MKSRILDQFYTKPDIARECLEITQKYILDNSINFSYWLEPSAGTGSFYSILPENKIGYDLEPKCLGVIEDDFLTVNLEKDDYVSIGNPPFGKNSSLAIKFLNKCSKNSKLVALILPRTFKKTSVLNRIDLNMHLGLEMTLPANSFLHNDSDYNVPCIFQIWEKKDYQREKVVELLVCDDIVFCDRKEANIAIQRVGNAAGKVKRDFEKYAASSHYFIKANAETISILESINWLDIKSNTAGNPSISKSELICEFIKNKQK